MPKKQRKFADDGWAVWIDGDDTSTIHINDWMNPKGRSYVDLAVRIRGVKSSRSLHVYIPFIVSREEIDDISLLFGNTKILQAIFGAACIVDYRKNAYTSEIAYNGKTVDIIHLSAVEYTIKPVSKGTLMNIPFDGVFEYLDNDEVYFMFRIPHKSISEVFRQRKKVGSIFTRFRDMIMSPIISESYGYSVRINEARLLPKEINSIGAFHRQKLKKAVVTISVADDYEINDVSCYRIRRLEEDLYVNFLPENFKAEDVVTYQWQQSREINLKGHFNFYFNVSRNAISPISIFVYMFIIVFLNALGGMMWDAMKAIYALIMH